jgi:hypothetical protein
MVSLFWEIAFHIVLIVCIGKRELDAPKNGAYTVFVIVRKANSITLQFYLSFICDTYNRQSVQLLVYACRGWWEVRYQIADYAEKFQ